MLLDLSMEITQTMLTDALEAKNKALIGHVGTHFDAMDKEFPLAYTERKGIVFSVPGAEEIGVEDVDLSRVEKDMFVAFHTGFSDTTPYGAPGYFKTHPQLTVQLIEVLLDKGVSIIGIDFAGIRRTPEHIPVDQRCADRGVFVIENLRNLDKLPESGFTVCTYPLNCREMTGLPCRVVAKLG